MRRGITATVVDSRTSGHVVDQAHKGVPVHETYKSHTGLNSVSNSRPSAPRLD